MKRRRRRNPPEGTWTPFILGATGLITILYLAKKATSP
jgi:hypothetical protein